MLALGILELCLEPLNLSLLVANCAVLILDLGLQASNLILGTLEPAQKEIRAQQGLKCSDSLLCCGEPGCEASGLAHQQVAICGSETEGTQQVDFVEGREETPDLAHTQRLRCGLTSSPGASAAR